MVGPRRDLRGSSTGLEDVIHKPAPRSAVVKRARLTRPAFLIPALLIGLLFASLTVFAQAQTPSAAAGEEHFDPAYDAAHEISIDGTIQKVITQHVTGGPAGVHLLLVCAQGITDAHLGPFLSNQTKAALIPGAQVHIVGAILSLHGKDYLLARLLTVSGRTITLRSEHGLLVRERIGGEPASRREREKDKSNGAKNATAGSEL